MSECSVTPVRTGARPYRSQSDFEADQGRQKVPAHLPDQQQLVRVSAVREVVAALCPLESFGVAPRLPPQYPEPTGISGTGREAGDAERRRDMTVVRTLYAPNGG